MKLKGGHIRKVVSDIIRKGMENKTEIINIPPYNTVMYSYLIY